MRELIPHPLKSLLDTPDVPMLGPDSRPGTLPADAIAEQLEQVFEQVPLTAERRALVRATVLLWHDHLESSHRVSQQIGTQDGSYVHGIMHRREPDYSNAKYWFHRVGQHRCFAALAERARQRLETQPLQRVSDAFVAKGSWDPFAFIDACEQAAGQPADDPDVALLRAIQADEMLILLRDFLGA